MPIAAGSPMWTGVPWAFGKRAQMVVARMAWAGVNGRIDTTIGPRNTPAGRQSMLVRYIGTLRPCSTCRTGTPGLQQGVLERERAAEQEGDEVVPPVAGDVGRLVDQFAVAEDAVGRHVGAEVGVRGDDAGHRVAGFGHVEQRARLRVALAEEQKVEGQVARHDDEVGLDVAEGEAGRRGGRVRRERQARRTAAAVGKSGMLAVLVEDDELVRNRIAAREEFCQGADDPVPA